uniref:Uncharacterized protein n=1 Tax=viral metagenome TaxID=1070528 RepID=A0A6M3IPV9_9ZZZZ
MKITKIYKIRMWVNEKRDRRGNLKPHPINKTEIVINNLEYAKSIYEQFKSEMKMYKGYKSYVSGYCQLFEPHIFENGTLAYWPDKEKYIEKYEF